jgi:hypothetical protein
MQLSGRSLAAFRWTKEFHIDLLTLLQASDIFRNYQEPVGVNKAA